MRSPSPAILLDLDGTLIDSQPGILSSCRAALRALGRTPDPGMDISALIGPPIEDMMGVLLRPHGDTRIAEAVAAYRADYGEKGLFQSVAYPGISEALRELRRSPARIFLATSKRTAFAVRILEHLGLAGDFEAIHGSEAGGALDHKPELISHVVERHGLAPRHSVMVGDRRYDIIGGHANGMRALGVLWGYGSGEELQAAGADAVISQPDSLPAAALSLLKRKRD